MAFHGSIRADAIFRDFVDLVRQEDTSAQLILKFSNRPYSYVDRYNDSPRLVGVCHLEDLNTTQVYSKVHGTVYFEQRDSPGTLFTHGQLQARLRRFISSPNLKEVHILKGGSTACFRPQASLGRLPAVPGGY